MLLNASFIISASRAQWAPMLLATAWIPAAVFVVNSPVLIAILLRQNVGDEATPEIAKTAAGGPATVIPTSWFDAVLLSLLLIAGTLLVWLPLVTYR